MQWGEWHGESVGYRRRDRSGPGGSSDGNRDRGVPDGLVDDRRFPWRRRAFAAPGSRPRSARGPSSAIPRAAGPSLPRAAAAPLPRTAAASLPRAAAGSLPRAAGSFLPWRAAGLPRRTAGAGPLPARRPVSARRVAHSQSIAPLRSFARTDAALTSGLQPENRRDEINTDVHAALGRNASLTEWCVVTVRTMCGLGCNAGGPGVARSDRISLFAEIQELISQCR